MRDSSVVLRSASQKNRASRSRAVTTRSALRAIVRSLSGSVLMTARNAFFSCAVLAFDRESNADGESASSSALPRGARGTRCANVPATTDGYSTRSGTSCSRPDSPCTTRLTRPCSRCALASSSRAILSCRSLRSRMTKFSSSRARYSSNDAHLDRAAGPAAGRQEAVAVGDRAGRDVLHLRRLRRRRARDRERHDAAAVDEQDPADRTAEQQLAAAVVEHRVPVHRFRKRQRAQRAAEHVGQHVDRRLAALPLAETRGSRLSASRSARAPTTSTPCFAAKPAAAGVGVPSGLKPGRHRRPVHAALRDRSDAPACAQRGRSAAAACCRFRPAPRAAGDAPSAARRRPRQSDW